MMDAAPGLEDHKPQSSTNDNELDRLYEESRARVVMINKLYGAPWWMLFLIIVFILMAINIATNKVYADIYDQLKEGISMTLGVSFFSYIFALIIALVVGIIRSNPPEAPQTTPTAFKTFLNILKTIVYNIATVYVEVMRGLPVLVVLLVTAFILVPMIRDDFINGIIIQGLRNLADQINGIPPFPTEITTIDFTELQGYLRLPMRSDFADLVWRGSSAPSAIAALAFTYGAYMSEVIRAGIQSVEKGQIEAAKSVGMTYPQTMRYIVLPQAFRNVLPPLGNDLIAMIKDSSLLAILGVRDITQVAKTSAGRSFRYIETYTIVAILYLTMTIIGSYLVRALEDTLSQTRGTPRWVTWLSAIYSGIFQRGQRKRKAQEK